MICMQYFFFILRDYIDWKNGALEKAEIKSLLGNNLKVRCGDKVIETKTRKGEIYRYDKNLKMPKD